MLKENQKYTIDELAIKLDLSRETIKRALKQLRECKIIERIGSDKLGNWEIKE